MEEAVYDKVTRVISDVKNPHSVELGSVRSSGVKLKIYFSDERDLEDKIVRFMGVLNKRGLISKDVGPISVKKREVSEKEFVRYGKFDEVVE